VHNALIIEISLLPNLRPNSNQLDRAHWNRKLNTNKRKTQHKKNKLLHRQDAIIDNSRYQCRENSI